MQYKFHHGIKFRSKVKESLPPYTTCRTQRVQKFFKIYNKYNITDFSVGQTGNINNAANLEQLRNDLKKIKMDNIG